MRPEAAVELAGVTFTYANSGIVALQGVDYLQRSGELVILTGKTGAGKSTLALVINGMIPHLKRGELRGSIQIFGESARQRTVSELARVIGLVFQDFEAQIFSTNVGLEVAFGPENLGLRQEVIFEKMAWALDKVGLSGLESRDTAALSGGQKQKLAIAAVLAMGSKLMILDEATTDLDPLSKEELFSLAQELVADDLTVLMIDHHTDLMGQSDRLAAMEDGRILEIAPPQEILHNPTLVSRAGIQAPQLSELMWHLGLEEHPESPQEAAEILTQRGWQVERATYEALLRAERERTSRYGDVILQLDDVSYTYEGGVQALKDVSLKVREGEFIALVGANGSGKTTLSLLANGLLKPAKGKVRVAGLDTRFATLKQLGQRIGYVFQNPDHQIWATSVLEEVSFAPRNFGMPEAQVRERVYRALEAVELSDREQEDPFSLAKGERQRVAVASVLAAMPSILLLDEPTTGLDFTQQQKIMELLKDINEAGHTVMVITHALWLVAKYCHRCVVMEEGRVLLDGATRDVLTSFDKLASARVTASEISRLGALWNAKLLTPAEAAACLKHFPPDKT